MNFLSAYKVSFSHNLKCLYANQTLMSIPSTMLGIFGTIFLYEQLHYSLPGVIAFFLLYYGSLLICSHAGAKLIGSIGMKKMLIIGMLLLCLATICLALVPVYSTLFLSLYLLFLTAHVAFYWVVYHVEFASFTNKRTRGKQLAFLSSILDGILAFTPVITGFIIIHFGFSVVFGIAVVVYLLSVIPLLGMKETHEEYTWSYNKLIRELFRKENKGLVLSNFADGMQAVTYEAIWPVFIFITVAGDYAVIGIITTIVTITIIALRFLVGYLLDRYKKETMVRIGSIIESTGWVAKVFIDTGAGIFLADTYHKIGSVTRGLSQETGMYEGAAENGHFVDEYIVLREAALMLGRVTMLALSLFLVYFVSIKSTFVLAALAALTIGFSIRKITIS